MYWPTCATPSRCRGIYGRLWLQEARLSSHFSYPHWIQRHDHGLAADVLGCLAADRTPQLEKRQLWYSIMSWKMKLTCQGLIESPAMASNCSGPDKVYIRQDSFFSVCRLCWCPKIPMALPGAMGLLVFPSKPWWQSQIWTECSTDVPWTVDLR